MEVHGKTLGVTQRCVSCGRPLAGDVDRCAHCGQQAQARRPIAPQAPVSKAQTAVNAPALYMNCAWQRPDGRWLSSKEVAEMEQLARQYASLTRSETTGWMAALGKLAGIKNSRQTRIASIRESVGKLGIEFGVFQAYAQAVRL
jgi:hypothetical protein